MAVQQGMDDGGGRMEQLLDKTDSMSAGLSLLQVQNLMDKNALELRLKDYYIRSTSYVVPYGFDYVNESKAAQGYAFLLYKRQIMAAQAHVTDEEGRKGVREPTVASNASMTLCPLWHVAVLMGAPLGRLQDPNGFITEKTLIPSQWAYVIGGRRGYEKGTHYVPTTVGGRTVSQRCPRCMPAYMHDID